VPLRTTDIVDGDIVDAYELEADGTSTFAYKSSVTVVSTTALTKRIVVSGYSLRDPDDPVEPRDIVVIAGSAAAGTYTIAEVIDDTTCTVNEEIPDSTGGTATFQHPPGATKVGFDPTGLSHTTSHTVQGAITDLDSEISAGGLTAEQHKTLRQLIHLAEGGGPWEGFSSGAYREILPTGDPFPTSLTWYDQVGVGKKKIVSLALTYNANKTIATEVWKVYDAAETLIVTVTDTISYSSVFESSRTRTIV